MQSYEKNPEKCKEIPKKVCKAQKKDINGRVHTQVPVFSKYQMQILDSIAKVKSDQELCDIKNLIAEYFSNKALDAMDKLCEDGTLTTETIQSWQSEHMRTPYKY